MTSATDNRCTGGKGSQKFTRPINTWSLCSCNTESQYIGLKHTWCSIVFFFKLSGHDVNKFLVWALWCLIHLKLKAHNPELRERPKKYYGFWVHLNLNCTREQCKCFVSWLRYPLRHKFQPLKKHLSFTRELEVETVYSSPHIVCQSFRQTDSGPLFLQQLEVLSFPAPSVKWIFTHNVNLQPPTSPPFHPHPSSLRSGEKLILDRKEKRGQSHHCSLACLSDIWGEVAVIGSGGKQRRNRLVTSWHSLCKL